MCPEELLKLIEQRLSILNLSAADASTRAVGNHYLIRNIQRRGGMPSVENLQALCAVLGLEFYIGPPRAPALDSGRGAENPPPLMADGTGAYPDLHSLNAARDTLSRVATMLAKRPSLDDPGALAGVGDEPADDARPVAVIEIAAAAGGGTWIEEAPASGNMWFRRDWLHRKGIDPKQCVIIGIKGDSMEPVLADGASILVDRTSIEPRHRRIYVIHTDDGLVAKRLIDQGDSWWLESSNSDYAPFALNGAMRVIGEVRWTARTLR